MTKHRIQLDPALDEQQLIDPDVLKRFADYCNIQRDETVLEIGPGAGNITEALLEKPRYLICIEKNPKYIPLLRERFSDNTKIKIIQDDALKTYLPKHDRLVSNLPYMIAEAFYQRTLRLGFKSATFIVPVGFADSLIAVPEDSGYSKLSWLSRLFYKTKLHETVPSEAYLPAPRVSTAIITLNPKTPVDDTGKALRELIQQGDKITKNALREALIRSTTCETKKEARQIIKDLNIEQNVLESWVSRLSLKDLQLIEERLTHKITG